jgi:glycosyltransferase involved in cell wall biosynthesis
MNELQDPLVSICCITYNHEEYIRDAIEGFLAQKTTFPLEIIIHDDASTDGTADIVREYEKKYPDIIKPIYQVENQYSKGSMIPDILTFQKAEGKYIAICEGDDYWTDPLKLQKQIEEMERHPECTMSFHPARLSWNDGVREDEIICFHSPNPRIFTTAEIIRGWGANFIPTASIVLTSEVIPRIISFFSISKRPPFGDYYIQILGSEDGGALYLNDVMSVYRKNVSGSYSDRLERKDPEFISLQALSILDTYTEIDKYTSFKFSEDFTYGKRYFILHILLSPLYDDRIVHEQVLTYYWKDKSISNSILWNTLFKYPTIIRLLRGFKRVKDRAR